MADALQTRAEALQPWLSALRRELHRTPELAWQEFATAAAVERELDRAGIPHRRIGETGVLGVIRGARPGGAVALRADMDALPVEEQNTCDYRSAVPGRMHACGHDGHTAMLLGAARLLAEERDALAGEVRLLFQPAEETGGGARAMIRAGALEGVRRVFGMHVATNVPVGSVGLKAGFNNASVDVFTVRVQGKGAHVSAPQRGVDALYIASHIVVAVQALVTRRTSAVEPLIIGIGKLNAGTAYNAVAESAVLEGTIRACSPQTRADAKAMLEQTVQGVAAMYGGSAAVVWDDIASVLVNDEAATAEVLGLVRQRRPDLTPVTDRPLDLAGEDFAEYLREVPGVFAYLGTADPARPETHNSIHNGRFEMDERALAIGAWLHAACALHWLGEGA